MAFTYPPSSPAGTLDGLTDVNTSGVVAGQSVVWNGTEWVPSGPFGSLNQAQIVQTGGLNLWIPRVTVLNRGNNAASLRDARALPLAFASAVRLTTVKVPFFNNLARTGTQPWGEVFANPGWQVRAFVYSSNAAGLPTTLLSSTGTSSISNTTDSGPSQGLLSITFPGSGLDVAANTPIWVVLISQPLFVAEFPEGWNPNNKYVYSEGVWSVDNESGGNLTSPLTLATVNQLAPIASLPEVPWFHEQFGFPFGSNSLYFNAPIFDYDGTGGNSASNISSWAGLSSWPSEQREWPTGSGNNMTFPYAGTGDSTFFYVQGQAN
jgi:hypothetical protein